MRLCLNCSQSVVVKSSIAKCQQIIYYRVPKSGSTTMGEVLKLQAKAAHYRYIWITWFQYIINQTERELYLKRISTVKNHRFVLVSHHYFFDFNKYLDGSLSYINVIREPILWFMSAYSYFRTQSKHFRNKWRNNRQTDKCVCEVPVIHTTTACQKVKTLKIII